MSLLNINEVEFDGTLEGEDNHIFQPQNNPETLLEIMLDDKDDLVEDEEIVDDKDQPPATTFTQVANTMQMIQEMRCIN